MAKKIGIDIRCLMGNKYSGVAWYTFNLLDNLFKLDQENEYFLFYNSSRSVDLPQWNYNNVNFRGFKYPNKLFNLSLNFLGHPYLDEMVGGVDLFFSPNLHFGAVSSRCQSIVAVHDLSFLIYPDFFTFKQRLWHRLILRKKILDRADVIISDSYSTKKDLMDLLKISEEKIKVSYLGVTEDYFRKRGEDELSAIKKKYDLPENFFLFLSTVEPRKNLLAAINAINKVNPDISLVVAGNWGWKMDKSKILSNSKIKFINYIAETDKAILYSLAQGLVYPSYYEGFGLPILEAMASGCPVIAGNNSSQGEVIGDCGLLVDPFNISEIKEAMDLLAYNNEFRNDLVARGRERARGFSWIETAQGILDIFNR